MILCQYKDIFGKPNEGAHKTRIPLLDIALVDVIGTLLLAVLISRLGRLNYWTTLILLFLFTEFLHWLFCVDTKLIVTIRDISKTIIEFLRKDPQDFIL
jgi:hypothetical protein